MDRPSIALACFICMVVTSAVPQASSSPPESETSTDEDYAIFSAALDGVHGKQNLNGLLVLDSTSVGYPPGLSATTGVGKELRTFYNGVPKDAKEDFDTRNKNRVELDAGKIRASFKTLSLAGKDAQELFHRKGGWQLFHQKYPGKVVVALLSRPGINRDRNAALLYLGESCGPTCGGGTMIFLDKIDGKWKVAKVATVWQS